MSLSEDDDLIRDASRELTRALREDGYPDEHPGRDWIKEQLDKRGRLPAKDILPEIGKAALHWAKDQGLERTGVQNDSTPKTMVSTSSDFAFGTYMRMLPHVRRVRQKVWGNDKPPFTGLRRRDEALQWLRDNEKKERGALGKTHPGQFKIVLYAKTEQLKAVHEVSIGSAPSLDEQRWAQDRRRKNGAAEQYESSTSLHNELIRLATAFEFSDSQLIKSGMAGAYESEDGKSANYVPGLEIFDGDGWLQSVHPPPNRMLNDLADEVTDIAKHSGWWSKVQTLTLIMCGNIPPAGVSYGIREGWHNDDGEYQGYSATTINLTVRGPTPEKEVIDTYRKVLKDNGLRPKKLSLKQAAVLQLVHKTPEMTWADRYDRWLEWCDLHTEVELPRYTRASGAASLCKEYQRALQASSWGKEG